MGRDKHERTPARATTAIRAAVRQHARLSGVARALARRAQRLHRAEAARRGEQQRSTIHQPTRRGRRRSARTTTRSPVGSASFSTTAFIDVTAPGFLGVEGKGKAPHWRLTELPYMGEPATRDFERWDGGKFVDQKTDSRAGNGARGVREMAHTSVREKPPT